MKKAYLNYLGIIAIGFLAIICLKDYSSFNQKYRKSTGAFYNKKFGVITISSTTLTSGDYIEPIIIDNAKFGLIAYAAENRRGPCLYRIAGTCFAKPLAYVDGNPDMWSVVDQNGYDVQFIRTKH